MAAMIQRGKPRRISLTIAVIFGVALAALLMIALFPIFPRQLDISAGQTAATTIRAPQSVSFESDYLTQQRRDEAAAAVPPALVFDPTVRSAQLDQYDRSSARIQQIRGQDTEDERKRDQLAQMDLSPRSIDTVLTLPGDRFDAVVAEGRRVLGEQLGVSLDEGSVAAAKDGVDSLISFEFGADEALVTAELVRPLITTTLTVDEQRTEEARAAARAAVPAERINVERNDVIVQAGSTVDQVAIEKLRAAGLLSRRVEWSNVIAAGILAVVAATVIAGYLYIMQPGGISSDRHMIALALVIAMPLLVAKFYLPLVIPDDQRHFLAFILPLAAAPILIAALLETDVAVLVSIVMGVLIAFISVFLPDVSLVTSVSALDTIRLLLLYSLPPIAGIYLVHRADRLNRYFTAGLAVAGVSFLVLLSTWFLDGERQAADFAWMTLVSGVGGVGSGVLAAGAFVTVGVMFGVTTRVQLMELSQLNSPLLRRLQDEAPGTFHHSIIVGNLAERAADLVGADPLLTRVGCYYHDIGKVLQPGMYIENQMGEDPSPHDSMPPEESTDIIRQHVLRGMELARRERLPARVQAFIPEHHGTRLVAYFYRKAAEDNPDIDPEQFRYPGPRPQSKETAIVMLADSTEALIRAAPDRSQEQIDRMVDDVVAERLSEGQLDECDLTLRDLRTIAESFKSTMRAVYHPRVQYPEPTAAEKRGRMLRLPRITPPSPRVTPPPAAPRRARKADRQG
jgi:cyclic-di-AMP phosphodiesterase PgpH